jgi:hypothetical protein
MKATTIPAMTSDRASQSAVIAPASSRKNLVFARKGISARLRAFGSFGPAAPVGAGLDVGSAISTSQLILPRLQLDKALPEKVVKLGQKHGQLMKNQVPIFGINRLISIEKDRVLS